MTELRVIRGDATPEELAAVVAILAAAGGAPAEAEEAPGSMWAAPQLRTPLPVPGPAAWTASALRL